MSFKAFPNIEFPSWLQELGFVDESWRLDVAAHAVKELAHGEGFLSVWCDYADASEREIEGAPRFSLRRAPDQDALSDSRAELLGDAETEDELRALIERALP
jgi:hypothetical protein